MLLAAQGLTAARCAADDATDDQADKDATIIQALLRLPNVDVHANPKLKQVVLRQLQRVRGTAEFVELVRRFQIREVNDELLQLAIRHPDDNLGVDAAGLLLQLGGRPLLEASLRDADEQRAVGTITTLGLVASPESVALLRPLVTDESIGSSRRNAAVLAIGRSRVGELVLLELVQQNQLAAPLQFSAATALLDSDDPRIREEASKYLTLPKSAGAEPLPPVSDLVRRKGDPISGKALFAAKATCAKCHKVGSEGKDVGPDLSEIGSKLSREAMFVSILDPNAAISHNYESYSLFLNSGNVVTGLLRNQTEAEVTIRTAEAIDKTIGRDEIEEMAKQSTSLMPADLQKLVSLEELVDIVEYLTTLRKQ